MPRDRVLIIYKSGAQIEIECDNFTLDKRGGELVRVAYEKACPRPMFIGISEIAAIYDLRPE